LLLQARRVLVDRTVTELYYVDVMALYERAEFVAAFECRSDLHAPMRQAALRWSLRFENSLNLVGQHATVISRRGVGTSIGAGGPRMPVNPSSHAASKLRLVLLDLLLPTTVSSLTYSRHDDHI